MIEQTYPCKKEAPLYVVPKKQPMVLGFSPFEIEHSQSKGITPEEWRRRNQRVIEEANKFFGKTGDTVFPVDKKEYEKYGPFMVMGVCRSYKDLSQDEWPASDTPMVLHLRNLRNQVVTMNATVGWVTKKNVHLCS